MSIKNQIVKNIFSNYAMNFLQMALGILLVPFLIAKLGSESFGLIVLVESTIMLFEIVTTSVRIALSRYVTYSLAQNKQDDFNAYLASGLVISLVSMAIVLLVGVSASMFFPVIFDVPESLVSQSKWLFLLITLSLAIVVPNIIFWSILYAKQRFDLINLSMSTGVLIRAISLFGLFSFLPDQYVTLPIYGAVYMLTTIIQNVMVIRFRRKIMSDLNIRLGCAEKAKIKEVMAFCAHSSLSRVNLVLYDSIAPIIINVFWGPAANAIYAVGLRIPTVLNRFFVDSTWALTPTFTDLVARKEFNKVEFLFFFYSKMMGLLIIPLLAGLVIFGPGLVYLWVGSEFHDAIIIMVIALASQFFTIPFAVCGCLLNAYGKLKLPSRIGLLFAVGNVILSIILGRVFDWGLTGIISSALITKALFNALFLLTYTCRISDIQARRFLVESFMKPMFLTSLVMSVPAFIIYSRGSQYDFSWENILLLALAGFVTYILGYLLICRKEEKETINAFFFQALNKVRGPQHPNVEMAIKQS